MIASMFTFVASPASAAGSTIYVSPSGSDSGNGSASSPYQTIAKARDAARNLTKPVTVILKEGTYYLSAALNFTSADSNVSYIGEEGKTVNVVGATRIDPSKITTADAASKNKVIDATAKNQLMVMDVSSYFPNGIPRYYSYGNTTGQFELTFYMGDTAMSRSRWPDTGYAKTVGKPTIASGTIGAAGSVYKYTADAATKTRMAKWSKTGNAFVLGFWGYEYNCESCVLTDFNTNTGTFNAKGAINTGDWYTAASMSARRVYFYNLIEEISKPGESYIDYTNKKVYFYPTSNFDKNAVYFSNIQTALFNFRDTTNVTLKNLNIGYCRRNAIDIRGNSTLSYATEDGNSRKFTIENCTIKHTSWTALTYYGVGLTVKNCKIYDTACGGISAVGGVRKSLTSGQTVISNTSILNFNRGERTYNCGIGCGSVGMKVVNCEVGGGIHEGVGISSNDVEISYSKFHDLVTETSDMGAIYYGRDPGLLGIKIHHNFFQNIGNGYGYTGQQSIYMDDGSMGAEIYSNIFVDAGGTAGNEPAAIKSHGAQFANIHENIFVDTNTPNYYGFQDAAWGGSQWVLFLFNQGYHTFSPEIRKKLTDVDFTSTTWRNHYAGTIWNNLYTYAVTYNASVSPANSNVVKNNVLVNMKGTCDAIWNNPNWTQSNNQTFTNSIFTGGYNLTSAGLSSIKAKISTFTDPQYSKMGPQGTIGATGSGSAVTPPASHTHTMQHTAAKAATCTATGNKAYYYCTGCKNYYTDAAGNTQTTLAALTVAKTAHTPTGSLIGDSTGHWQKCSVCGGKTTVNVHINNTNADGSVSCVLCNYQISGPVCQHSLTYVAAKAATCLVEGNSAHYKCTKCNSLFTDAAGTSATTLAAVTIAKTSHSFGTTLTGDATGHYTTCSVCGTKGTVNIHITDTAADGSVVCVLCNYKVSGPVCQHSMVYTAAKAATCLATGNTAYYSCSKCGIISTDAAGANVTTLAAVTIAKTSHSFGTTLTGDVTGHYTTCSVCGTKGTVNVHVPNVENATETTNKYCVLCNYVMETAGGGTTGPVIGDADGDGKCTNNDVVFALKYLLFGMGTNNGLIDCNGDGRVNLDDSIAILNKALF